ncbi:MAG: TylF/MycF/NovP-related O-methyltransferase [Bacteroidales bacterium]|jgi:hypothetical protein|nr:TylF/MycF/NovP-related O-methyltransferase [Bacteroidales bacterium]
MIHLPDPERAFEYENNFYLTCDNQRIAKLIAQYELFRMSAPIAGDIVECGVFKGSSLIRFVHFRELSGLRTAKRITGFDTFGLFPPSTFEPDNELLDSFLRSAGNSSISREQLGGVLEAKGLGENILLVEGDIRETIPAFVRKNRGLSISLLNLDVDLYEPSLVILEYLYPLISPGGILMLDDYDKFPGETRAVDEYFSGQNIKIRRFPYVKSPSYIIKDN